MSFRGVDRGQHIDQLLAFAGGVCGVQRSGERLALHAVDRGDRAFLQREEGVSHRGGDYGGERERGSVSVCCAGVVCHGWVAVDDESVGVDLSWGCGGGELLDQIEVTAGEACQDHSQCEGFPDKRVWVDAGGGFSDAVCGVCAAELSFGVCACQGVRAGVFV